LRSDEGWRSGRDWKIRRKDDIQESEDKTVPPVKIRKRNKLKAKRGKKSTMRKSLFGEEEQVYICMKYVMK
jgi:hypothetical protein